MLIHLLLFAAGVLLVFAGSDLFVNASVVIGERARLPRVVVGGTLVSLATTSPELVVSIMSGIDRVPGLAIGNALGSVAANLGLILGLAAIIRPFELPPGEFRRRSLMMLGFAVVLFLMTFDSSLPRWRGFILVGIGLLYLFLDYRRGLRRFAGSEEAPPEMEHVRLDSGRKVALFFLLGAAMVVGGSRLLVTTGSAIALEIGVRPVIVGLTMVAVGTSLPELSTAIAAVRKRVFDLSVGNLVGANALNLTLVTGAAASFSSLKLTRATQLYTFPAILLILVAFFLLMRTKSRMMRWEGMLLMGLYAGFVAGLLFLDLS